MSENCRAEDCCQPPVPYRSDTSGCDNDDPVCVLTPEVCLSITTMVLKPSSAIVEVLSDVRFRAFLVVDGVEQEIASGVLYRVSDTTISLIGASSGNATGLAPGIISVFADYGGFQAQAQLEVIGEGGCAGRTNNYLLLFDISKSSLQGFVGSYPTRIEAAKAFATDFTDRLNPKDSAAVMVFDDNTTVVQVLTSDTATLATAISGISATQDNTDLATGLADASNYLSANATGTPVIVVFTDGENNRGINPVTVATSLKDNGTVIMVVGLRAAGGAFNMLEAVASGGFFLNAIPTNLTGIADYLSGLKSYLCGGDCTPPGDVTVGHGHLNFHDFINWDVTDKQVDLIGQNVGGPALYDFLPGHGLYVDGAGSTGGVSGGDLGTLKTKNSFPVTTGHNYRFSIKIAGNQREERTPDVTRLQVLNESDVAIASSDVSVTDYAQDFTTYSVDFTAPAGVLAVKLLVRQLSIPTGKTGVFGSLWDDIALTDLTVGSEYRQTQFTDPIDGPANGLSGLTYSPITGTLFGIRNVSSGQSATYEWATDGTLLRTISHANFTDTEGICWMYANRFAICEENPVNRITIVTIDPGQVTLDRNDYLADSFPTGVASDNLGIEGCGYDLANALLYFSTEKAHAGVWKMWSMEETSGTVAELFDIHTDVSNYITDISDIYFHATSGKLFILSDESNAVLRVTIAGVVEKVWSVRDFDQPEGLAFLPDLSKMFVSGESAQFAVFEQFNGSVFSDGFDDDNPVTIPPCDGYGGYGYCNDYGCLDTPIPSQVPDPNPLALSESQTGGGGGTGTGGTGGGTVCADTSVNVYERTFAIIGDYGEGNAAAEAVAAMVESWSPDYVATNGDNWYGAVTTAANFESLSNRLYRNFVYPYLSYSTPALASTATRNNFYPTIGNHDRDPIGHLALELADWHVPPYFYAGAWHTSTGFYHIVRGLVEHFFYDAGYDSSQVIQQASGVDVGSDQWLWLQAALLNSTARWKIVHIHHPSYTSTPTVSSAPTLIGNGYLNYTAVRNVVDELKALGVDLVCHGHAHTYERLSVNGLPIIINGMGGSAIATFTTPIAESIVRFRADYGAQKMRVSRTKLISEFRTVGGLLVDSFTITKI